MLLGRREGVCKKSALCTLVKMLKIMNDPKAIYFYQFIDMDTHCTVQLFIVSIPYQNSASITGNAKGKLNYSQEFKFY